MRLWLPEKATARRTIKGLVGAASVFTEQRTARPRLVHVHRDLHRTLHVIIPLFHTEHSFRTDTKREKERPCVSAEAHLVLRQVDRSDKILSR